MQSEFEETSRTYILNCYYRSIFSLIFFYIFAVINYIRISTHRVVHTSWTVEYWTGTTRSRNILAQSTGSADRLVGRSLDRCSTPAVDREVSTGQQGGSWFVNCACQRGRLDRGVREFRGVSRWWQSRRA